MWTEQQEQHSGQMEQQTELRGRVCLACVRISQGVVIRTTARCLVPDAVTSRQDPYCHH